MDREAPGTKTKRPSSMHKKGNGVVGAESQVASCKFVSSCSFFSFRKQFPLFIQHRARQIWKFDR